MANDRLTDFSLQYDLIDLEALSDCTISTEDSASFSDPSLLSEGEEFPDYMTWEHNHNILDGSLTHFTEDTYTSNNIAFFSSEMSDEDGLFTTNPTIDLSFSSTHTSIGLTLYFIGEAPLEATIAWYTGGVEITSGTYSITSTTMFIDESVTGYDQIVIEFTKTIPYRYVKLYGMLFGKQFNWDETVIKSGNLVQEVNMLMDKLSINTLSFEIIDLDNTLNFGNTDNIIQFFTRKQPIYPEITIDDTTTSLGKYYLDKVTADNNIAKFTAFSAIGLLDNVDFNEGLIYDGTLAGVVIAQIFDLAGITSYTIDDTTYNMPLYGTIKPCTCREALQKILFVCRAIVLTNTDEYQLVIQQPSTSLSGKITRATKISTKVSDAEYITGVKLSYTLYTEGSSASEILTDTYDAGTHTIIFSAPYSDIYLSDSDITIVTSSTYYITFTLTSSASVTIYGTPYTASTNNITLNRTTIKSGAIENVKSFSTDLCDFLRASTLTYDLLSYYTTSSLDIEIKTIASDNSMIGKQIVYNSISSLSNYVGRYSSRVFDLTGGFIDTSKLVGYYASASSDEYYTSNSTDFVDTEDMFSGDYLI